MGVSVIHIIKNDEDFSGCIRNEFFALRVWVYRSILLYIVYFLISFAAALYVGWRIAEYGDTSTVLSAGFSIWLILFGTLCLGVKLQATGLVFLNGLSNNDLFRTYMYFERAVKFLDGSHDALEKFLDGYFKAEEVFYDYYTVELLEGVPAENCTLVIGPIKTSLVIREDCFMHVRNIRLFRSDILNACEGIDLLARYDRCECFPTPSGVCE